MSGFTKKLAGLFFICVFSVIFGAGCSSSGPTVSEQNGWEEPPKGTGGSTGGALGAALTDASQRILNTKTDPTDQTSVNQNSISAGTGGLINSAGFAVHDGAIEGGAGISNPNAGSEGIAPIGGTDIFGQSGSSGTVEPVGGSDSDSTPSEEFAALNPFGCSFAWGTNTPEGDGSLDEFSFLQFITTWVGWGIKADGTIDECWGCDWLANRVSHVNLIPVYYAYFIGEFGHANGLQDGNINPNGPNLTTHVSALIKSNRSQLIQTYASYAKRTYQVWKDKPLVWLLEGDFIQYTESTQTEPLSMVELGQLAFDITNAIKDNMPNAIVAINHTTWNSNEETDDFWTTMQSANVNYDLVWTTGVANNNGYIESSTDQFSYNHATATYAYVHQLTGRNILVDTSFGASAMADTWASTDAATLNARIVEGVIAANIVTIPWDYSTRVANLSPLLNSTCE